MLKSVIGKGAAVKLCGTCVDARGLRDVKLIDGVDLFTIQKLLGHRNIRTTSIYLHLQNKHLKEVINPFDRFDEDGR